MVKLTNIPRRTVAEIDREIAPLQHRLQELLEERAAAEPPLTMASNVAGDPPVVQQVRRYYADFPKRLKKQDLVSEMARRGYWMPPPVPKGKARGRYEKGRWIPEPRAIRGLTGRYDELGRLSRAIARELSSKVRGRDTTPPRLKLDRQGCVIPADWEK